MKTRHILMILALIWLSACGPTDPLLMVFNDQVEAFNRADVDRMAHNVADDFKWYYIASDSLYLEVEGKENFQKGMESYFQAIPGVSSKIERWVIDGKRISFKESVSWEGKNGRESQSAMGIYEIRKNKIYRAWYFTD